MTKTLLRAGALSCALLASTALSGPALAQASGAAAPAYHHLDANGVDVTRGTFELAVPVGSIGSGEETLSLVNYFGTGNDNWTLRFRRSLSNGSYRFSVTLGNRTETFTGAVGASSFASAEGNGATLTLQSDGSYHYRDAAGALTVFTNPFGDQGGTSTFCSSAVQVSCDMVPESTTAPSGRTLTYHNEADQNCKLASDGETLDCQQYYRLSAVSNDAGYRISFLYASNTRPTTGFPSASWRTRVGASFSNLAVAPTPQASASYAYPSATLTDITDTAGRSWRITRNSSQYVIGVRRPGSSADNISIARDANGIVTQVTADGIVTNYARTVSGNSATMTITDALSQQSTVVSDLTIGRPTSTTDALGLTTTIQYDAQGRPTRVTAPELNYVETSYDARGNVTQTVLGAKPGSGTANIVTSATFAPTCANSKTCNLPLTTTDAGGNVTDYSYDQGHGGLLTVTAPAPSVGAVRPQTRYSYTLIAGVHRLTETSACQTQATCAGTGDEVRTTIGYGANNLPVSVTSGPGDGSLPAVQTLSYDAIGNLTSVDGPLTGPHDTARFRYDAARRRTHSISPDPDGAGPLLHRAERLIYRADGQVEAAETGTIDNPMAAGGGTFTLLDRVEREFDASNRPVRSTLRVGGAAQARTAIAYDALGRVSCTALRMDRSDFGGTTPACDQDATAGTDGPDRIVRNVYDALGRVTETWTAVDTPLVAREIRTTYTANGQVESVTDGELNHTFYLYDGLDRLRRTQYPMPAQGANASNPADYDERTYDTAGRMASFRNRAGEVTGFEYDALGRLKLKNLPDSEPDVSYGYDLFGRMTSASRPGHSLTFGYDGLGRLRTQSGPFGTYTASYDRAGRRTGLTHPDGFYVEYDLLTTGEAWRIRENGATAGAGVLATFGYDDRGRRTSLTRGNGTSTSYAYNDPAGRLSQMSHDMAGPTHDLNLGFTYNPAGQIATNSRSNDLYRFNATPATTTETPNGLNQLAQRNGAALSFDARGNMTNDGERGYTYSSENRLRTAGSAGFFYDALGRLSGTGAATATQPSVHSDWMGDELVAERSSTGAVARRHVYAPGIDEPIVWYEGAGTTDRRWLHADERGSIVATSDASGAVLNVNSYDEYGRTS
ncbi:MAG TPA: hypothetical protein VGB08_06420, partial [Allosphingosinicella sp.]